jgi:ribonuclease P/MRP protein subunit RPP40
MSEEEIAKVESVQRKATKMFNELRGCRYHERLSKLGLTDLENRRKRGDLIQIFKLVYGLEVVDIGIKKWENVTQRSHTHQLVREICKENMGRYRFLTNRTATTWNLQSTTVVNAKSVNSFKAALDDHMTAGRLRRSVYKA